MYICIAVDTHHPNIPNASLETPSFPSDTKMLAHVDFMDPTISGEGTGWTKAAQVVAVSIEQNESSLLRELIGDTETAEGEGVQQEEEESEVEEGMGKREARQDAMNEGMGRNRAVPYPRHPAPRPPTSDLRPSSLSFRSRSSHSNAAPPCVIFGRGRDQSSHVTTSCVNVLRTWLAVVYAFPNY